MAAIKEGSLSFEALRKNIGVGTGNCKAKRCLNSKKFIKDYVDRKGQYSQGLIYMGAPGLGKTHIVVSVIKELVMQHGIECKFVDFFELLRDIRHGYGEDISEKDFIDPYVGVKVLVIDELAKGRNTDWEITILDHFISTRYNDDDKVTLVTTNFSDTLATILEISNSQISKIKVFGIDLCQGSE